MFRKYRPVLLITIPLLCLFLLTGCGLFGDGVSGPQKSLIGAKVATPDSAAYSHDSNNAPVVIESPTAVSNASDSAQQLGLSDRVIVIEDVSEQIDDTATFAKVTLKLTFKNIGNKDINNLATAYNLVGAEGDIFGLQPADDNAFFGMVAVNSERNGMVAFQQIPSAATNRLRLYYHTDSSQIVFASLPTILPDA